MDNKEKFLPKTAEELKREIKDFLIIFITVIAVCTIWGFSLYIKYRWFDRDWETKSPYCTYCYY